MELTAAMLTQHWADVPAAAQSKARQTLSEELEARMQQMEATLQLAQANNTETKELKEIISV